MRNSEIEKIVRREATVTIAQGTKKVEAWRKKGGYVVLWTGFENEAPRSEKSSKPFFIQGISIDEIREDFQNAVGL